MKKKSESPFLSAAFVCVLLGLLAWIDFFSEISNGDLDLLNFETILMPVGIGLLRPGRMVAWVARLQLFLLALYSGVIVFGFLFMTEETRFLVFESDKMGGHLSGAGIALFLHSLFLAGILWVYFSIFTQQFESKPLLHIN